MKFGGFQRVRVLTLCLSFFSFLVLTEILHGQ